MSALESSPRFYTLLLWIGFSIFACLMTIACAAAQTPISGAPVSVFALLDIVMQNLMTQYTVPGAELAVAYNGRLVYARGYGWAKQDTYEPVQPDSLFRVASNAKQFTATAILQLIEQGKLSLSTQPFATVLNELGTPTDSRLLNITIQNLLEHKGGWDDTVTGVPDPVLAYVDTAATALGATPPAQPEQLIQYMLGKTLQHDPGTVYAYSNFGYVVLGAVIGRVSGETYINYIRDHVLTPAGLVRVQHGGTLLSDRLPYEVAYYDYPSAPLVSSVVAPIGSPVPDPYGAFYMDLHQANGGWTASAVDLARYAAIMNGEIAPALLNSPPTTFVGYVPPVGAGWTWYFYGSLPGSNSLNHLSTGSQFGGAKVIWAATFNTRNRAGDQPQTDADNQIANALLAVKSWPSSDLFPEFQGAAGACGFTLSSTSITVTIAAVSNSASVTDKNNCAWLAISNASWIHVTSGAVNSDTGSFGYAVDAYTGGTSRTGTISVAGQPFTITQNPTPSISLVSNPATTTINAGQTATFTLTVTPSGGFAGAVSFTCAGLPTYAMCQFSPSTMTVTGASASTALTIITNVKTAQASPRLDRLPGYASGGPMLALLLFAPWLIRRMRQRVLCLALLLTFSLGTLAGCGDPAAKTPSGTSTVRVTASGSGTSATASISLTVAN